jgi:hypothetical protein
MHKSRAIDEQQISTRLPLWLAATMLVPMNAGYC